MAVAAMLQASFIGMHHGPRGCVAVLEEDFLQDSVIACVASYAQSLGVGVWCVRAADVYGPVAKPVNMVASSSGEILFNVCLVS